ncbi:hypothetical protein Agub_g6990 [Astrephomene gubernaculifera]|uniref:Band 7 domain-containing protein n=1 Tax=Astrephomene gubernaculifera TaxID=47775 RepID=A0AAD3DPF0_9CHLO|nr:hypothetical protein Agub_g6990 [Astrephomene gubernaculifera]
MLACNAAQLRNAGLLGQAAPALARGLFQIVHQGTEAYRTILGRSPKKLNPGLHWNIPILHNIQVVDMREGPINIRELDAFTKDNVPVNIGGTLFYQVTDSYKACFAVQGCIQSVANLGTSAMRSVVGLFQYDDIISDRNLINSKLQQVVGELSMQWGVTCTKFEIQTFKPSNQNVERQLEQQMEAERARRRQILDTQAAINVSEGLRDKAILEAEGLKRKAILESEGIQQALRNRADAELYSAERNTQALKLQLEEMKSAFGGDLTAAANYLLRLKQVEQMTAIAAGQNNSTYFLNGGVGGGSSAGLGGQGGLLETVLPVIAESNKQTSK